MYSDLRWEVPIRCGDIGGTSLVIYVFYCIHFDFVDELKVLYNYKINLKKQQKAALSEQFQNLIEQT
jgi:hypothetical protein